MRSRGFDCIQCVNTQYNADEAIWKSTTSHHILCYTACDGVYGAQMCAWMHALCCNYAVGFFFGFNCHCAHSHTHVSVRTRTSIPRRRRPTPTNVLARFQGHIRVRACNNICSAYARTHAQRNAACDLRTRRMVYVCMCVCVFVCNTKRL